MSSGCSAIYDSMMERETEIRLFGIDLSRQISLSVDYTTTEADLLTSVSRWTATALGYRLSVTASSCVVLSVSSIDEGGSDEP